MTRDLVTRDTQSRVFFKNTEVRMAKPCSVVARYDITNAPQLLTDQLKTAREKMGKNLQNSKQWFNFAVK